MGFWEHLDELRGTLIKSIVVLVGFAVLIAYGFSEFNDVLTQPLDEVAREYPKVTIKLGTAGIMEGFNVLVQICCFGAVMLAGPFILYFIGQFVAPALTAREMKAVLPMCIAAFSLFIAGAVFSYYVLLESALRMMIDLHIARDWEIRWTVGSYYSILIGLVLGVGATFQFPLVIVLLVWLGLTSTAFLRRYRRHAIVLLFIVAAAVTPSTDPANLLLFVAPLLVLYEIAIVVAARVERHRDRPAAAAVLALLALLPVWSGQRGGKLAGTTATT